MVGILRKFKKYRYRLSVTRVVKYAGKNTGTCLTFFNLGNELNHFVSIAQTVRLWYIGLSVL